MLSTTSFVFYHMVMRDAAVGVLLFDVVHRVNDTHGGCISVCVVGHSYSSVVKHDGGCILAKYCC